MAAGTGTSSHAESPLVKLLGAELVTSAGTKVKTADRLAGKTTVGLYFSAHCEFLAHARLGPHGSPPGRRQPATVSQLTL